MLKAPRAIGSLLIPWVIAGLCAWTGTVPALGSPGESVEIRVAKTAANERYEREVDEVALASLEKAIQRLQILIKKYNRKSQEPILLAKLADIQQQAASIVFRVAHGNAHNRSGAPKALDLSRFNRSMEQAIKTFGVLITKYPGFEEIPHAYYGRGKGYEEIGNTQKATADYLHLVKNFPDAEDTVSAYMALAEFSIQANDHPRAITYLKQVEKHEESPHFPFALYKLAWSHYNLKDIPTALSYAERQIVYYGVRAPKDQNEEFRATSDNALRENTLLDVPVFLFEGYEQKIPVYSLANALSYLRKIESGPSLGKMFTRFAKLLRSHNHEDDLIAWKDQILQSESDRSESLDVLLIAYEYQLNNRKYPQVVESTQDIVRLYKKGKTYEAMPRAQKMVLDTAEGLQQVVIKNKDAVEVRGYSTTLATIYDAFTKIVEEKDPRIPRVHYNLAETLFAIKDFPGATDHYRWVVDHQSWSTIAPGSKTKLEKGKPAEQGSVADASLKAIASRYEVLRQKQLIPTELQPKALSKASTKTLEPMLSQWIEWISTHVKHEARGLDNFVFESNRALYAQGHLPAAMENFRGFLKTYPSSQYATPSASLMLDTMIASEDWEKTHELATEFMTKAEWKIGEFAKRLFSVASDAFYKRTEALFSAKDYAAALKNVDEFLKKYSESIRLADALTLAGNAALAANDKTRAAEYYSRLIAEASKGGRAINPNNLGAALLARASLAEERYAFAAAATDYRAFLLLPSGAVKVEASKQEELRRKTLTLIWLSDDSAELKATLDNKAICTESLAAECEKFQALATLARPEGARASEMTEKSFDRARKDATSKENRALWAVIALEGAKNLAFRDRNVAMRVITNNWGELDPLARFAVLPYLTVSIPRAFQLNRAAMKDVAPLRADEKYITHRVDMIREMENAATKAVKLPWARIRAEVLNEIAGLYLDLARGLSALNPPKGLNPDELTAYQDTIRKLVMPFEEKGQDMRSKAFEIASRFAIEEESFRRISEPFFAENPSQAKKLRASGIALPDPAAVSLSLLEQVDPQGDWRKARAGKISGGESGALLVKTLWASALQARKWQQVAYFMQEAKEKSHLASPIYGAVKAVSLATAGARGEALLELDDARKELTGQGRISLTLTLAQHYQRAYAQERAQALNKELQAEEAAQKEKRAKS